MKTNKSIELVCPAGNFPSVKAAIDNGADAVYIGLNNKTNARYFSGLNFSDTSIEKAVQYVRDLGKKVFVAINTYPQEKIWHQWCEAVDIGASLEVDALIIADIGVLQFAAEKYPHVARHLSVQGSATNLEALMYYHENFGIKRAVLPRVLSLKQVERLIAKAPIELEVFGFGSLCIMAEGRCYLSSYVTGDSPNNCGACSPAHAVRWEETAHTLETRLNGVLIDRFKPGDPAGYPTLCKGRFQMKQHLFHALEEPVSLNALDMLPQLAQAGIAAIKIEGRQRAPAYVAKVASVWRQAIDRFSVQGANYQAQPDWHKTLASLSEGSQTTLGAYHRPWQ
jgi:collagenase-like PrtC family protease